MATGSAPQRLRNESESWVEVSSQPSSSSLSSIGDEIVLTGLRVQHDSNTHRRRGAKRPRNSNLSHSQQTRQYSHSSQEEYDESESDEDHVLTSSNEHLSPQHSAHLSAQQQTYHTSSSDDDADENGTALGIGRARNSNPNERTFTPQPNAFSHPSRTNNPSSHPSAANATSYFPRTPAAQPRYHSYSGRSAQPTSTRERQQHTPFTGTSFSPSSQDHDAALRASLTTLLSCAAAARGLPKRNQSTPNHNQSWGVLQGQPGGNQEPNNNMGGLRLVPESALLNDEEPPPGPRNRTSGLSSASRGTPLRSDSNEGKQPRESTRKIQNVATNTNAKDKDRERIVKKKRTAETREREGDLGYFYTPFQGVISPTFFTWVVSAGVVVLVGVVGFGAGYAMGREVGFQEGGGGVGVGGVGGREGVGCAKEVVGGGGGGLRKFRMAITA